MDLASGFHLLGFGLDLAGFRLDFGLDSALSLAFIRIFLYSSFS